MFKGFIPLCLTTVTLVILWFIESFYFVLNDRDYGTAGMGLFLLVVAQAIIIIAGTTIAYCFLEDLDKQEKKNG